MLKKKSTSRTIMALLLGAVLVGQPLLVGKALADGGDFHLDFVAAAPGTYVHTLGGGAYNDGKNPNVVESLEGGDFACFDVVTFLTQISVDSGAVNNQSIELLYEFTAYSTGQQGVALDDILFVGVNPANIDSGTNGTATATLKPLSETLNGTAFVKPTKLTGIVQVSGLDAGETIVVRVDVRLDCNGQSPTGNMQARLASGAVTAPLGETGVINTGDQTVPFKNVGRICKDPKDCPPPPK